MGDPGEQTRNSALMKAAAAFELLMGAVGTETRQTEDSDRVAYLSGELNTAVEQARALRPPPSE